MKVKCFQYGPLVVHNECIPDLTFVLQVILVGTFVSAQAVHLLGDLDIIPFEDARALPHLESTACALTSGTALGRCS